LDTLTLDIGTDVIEVRPVFVTAAMTIGFANCRNVTTRDVSAEPNRQRLQSTRKIPRMTFRELEIDGLLCRPVRSEPWPGETESERRCCEHAVRGHIAHYTADRPMFGRLAGNFWIPPHLRGDPNLGTVDKDYWIGPDAVG
jgi:hypothetical protein